MCERTHEQISANLRRMLRHRAKSAFVGGDQIKMNGPTTSSAQIDFAWLPG